jgi:hypothetical protein
MVLSSKVSRVPVTNVGNGYNTFFETAMATSIQVDTQTGQGSTSSNIYVCTSTEQVYKALGINAAMDIDGGWGSFSDSLKFVQAMGQSTTSVVILVVATVVSSTQTAKTWSWLPSQPPGDAKDLYRQGGDSFISSVTKGGQYLASYTFNMTDEDSFISLSNEANLEFSGWGTDFTLDFAVRMQNIASKTTVSYNFDQIVIGFSSANLPKTMSDLISFVESIGTLPVDNPAVFDYSTTSYTAVNGGPDFTWIDNYRSQYVDPSGTPGYSDYELRAKTNRSIIQAASDLYNHYGCVSVDDLLRNIPIQLDTMLASISAWRKAVDRDPTKPGIIPPTIDTSMLIIPYPRYGLQVEPTVGGGDGGGDLFTDVTIKNVLQGVLPSQITIKGSSWINKINTTYEVLVGAFSQPSPHGGNDGRDFPAIGFGPGEFVTSIIASAGIYVNKLTIATTNNPNGVAYPSNPEGAPNLTWNTPANGCFIGWTGRSGIYLNNIAPMYVTFQACNWVVHPSVNN